jgi:hypothetical protein
VAFVAELHHPSTMQPSAPASIGWPQRERARKSLFFAAT